MTPPDAERTVVVLNPQSGSGDHVDAVAARTELLGYRLERTEGAGDAIRLAREAAASGATTIVAAGGDGTVNEVLRGIDRAGAFDRVLVGVVPVGTGNDFAGNVGLTDVDVAFDAIDGGRRRRIDLGRADGHLFVNSCVAGLTADASSETSADLKNRFGVLAYVVTTMRQLSEFEGLHLAVDVDDGGDETTAWEGEAICVLIGNARRFTPSGSTQANVEDGRFDVTIIEDVSTIDLMGDAVLERVLKQDGDHVTRLQASDLDVTVNHPEAVRFSLDGEIVHERALSFHTEPATVRIAVGPDYDPNPD